MFADSHPRRWSPVQLGVLGGVVLTIVYGIGFLAGWEWIAVGRTSSWSMAAVGVDYGLFLPAVHVGFLLVPPFVVASLVFTAVLLRHPEFSDVISCVKWYLATPLYVLTFLAVALSVLAPLVASLTSTSGPGGPVSSLFEGLMMTVIWLMAVGPLVVILTVFATVGSAFGILWSVALVRPVRRGIRLYAGR